MKKTFLFAMVALILCVACTFAFAACNPDNNTDGTHAGDISDDGTTDDGTTDDGTTDDGTTDDGTTDDGETENLGDAIFNEGVTVDEFIELLSQADNYTYNCVMTDTDGSSFVSSYYLNKSDVLMVNELTGTDGNTNESSFAGVVDGIVYNIDIEGNNDPNITKCMLEYAQYASEYDEWYMTVLGILTMQNGKIVCADEGMSDPSCTEVNVYLNGTSLVLEYKFDGSGRLDKEVYTIGFVNATEVTWLIDKDTAVRDAVWRQTVMHNGVTYNKVVVDGVDDHYETNFVPEGVTAEETVNTLPVVVQ